MALKICVSFPGLHVLCVFEFLSYLYVSEAQFKCYLFCKTFFDPPVRKNESFPSLHFHSTFSLSLFYHILHYIKIVYGCKWEKQESMVNKSMDSRVRLLGLKW